jgi:ATP-dependent Clp protease adapter protein ClpS
VIASLVKYVIIMLLRYCVVNFQLFGEKYVTYYFSRFFKISIMAALDYQGRLHREGQAVSHIGPNQTEVDQSLRRRQGRNIAAISQDIFCSRESISRR